MDRKSREKDDAKLPLDSGADAAVVSSRSSTPVASGPAASETAKRADGNLTAHEGRQHELTDPSDWSQEEDRQEFFLPVSGFVWLFPEEVSVVDHPAFQRLGLVYQLGQAYVVYRGATHKRFEHSMGTLQSAQRMIEAIEHNSKKKRAHATSALTCWERRFVRLGALLHDIGHMAAGHTLEDELSLAPRHDEDNRLDLVFGVREPHAEANGDHKKHATELPMTDRAGRTLAQLIDEIYKRYVPDSISSQGVSASDIVRLLIRKAPKNAGDDRYAKCQHALSASADIRLKPCQDIIGNTICADILDYLHRDWYHIGKPRPFDERLLHYMEIRNQGTPRSLRSPEDRFVISLGQRPKLRTDAISNILDLLEWRYQLCESVLFHRTKLCAAAMLDRALFELWGGGGLDVERTLLPLSDEELLSTCLAAANEQDLKDQKKRPPRDNAAIASSLLASLKKRELFAPLSTRFHNELPSDVADKVKREYAGVDGDARQAAAARNRVLRILEADFALPAGSLAMYCSASVNAKIAKVLIAVGDEIKPLDAFEVASRLAGGHLQAQLDRFQKLWRVHFFIDSSLKDALGERLQLLQNAVEKLALGNLVDDETSFTVARSIASALVRVPNIPWAGGAISDDTTAAAFRDDHAALGSYPLGAPAIRSFIKTRGDRA